MNNNVARLFLFFFCFLTVSLYSNPISITSDFLQYDDNSKQVTLQDNVTIFFNDTSIKTDLLLLDTETQEAYSSGRATIRRDMIDLDSESLYLNLKRNTIRLSQLHFSMIPTGVKNKLYVSIQDLTQSPVYQWGKWAKITSCDLPHHPHHYINAWRFRYKPDSHVLLYGAYLYNKFTFFPFNLTRLPVPLLEVIPIPFYYYNVGKRHVVWSFPTISKKRTPGWGWVVQNSFDYNVLNGKESSILLDWYETKGSRQGEWGYGLNHQYQFKNHTGTLYYYRYVFSQLKQNQRTQLNNNSFTIDHLLTLSNYSSLKFLYKHIDVEEKIKSAGSDKRLIKNVTYNWSRHGNRALLSLNQTENFLQDTKQSSLSFSRHYFDTYSYSFNFNDNMFYTNQKSLSDGEFKFSSTLFNDISFNQTVSYLNQDFLNDPFVADESLKSYTTFKTTLANNVRLTLKLNQFFDLDSDRYSGDSTSAANNFLASIPELIIQKSNYSFLSFKQSSTLTIGHYSEVKYLSNKNQSSTFPNYTSFFLEPNVYHLSHNMSKSISKLPFKTTLHFSSSYDQYIFKNKDLSLFEGDAQYSLSLNSSLKSTLFNFIDVHSSLIRRFAPEENNSPFYAFKKSVTEQHKATGGLALFYNQTFNFFPYAINFRLAGSTGYNWLRDSSPWDSIQYLLTCDFTNRFKLSMSTNQEISTASTPNNHIYSPLIINLKTIPIKSAYFNYNLILDLNDLAFEDRLNIKQSTFDLSFPLGKQKDYQWRIKTIFSYAIIPEQYSYHLSNYEMQSLSIVKQEHRRTLEIGYNKTNDELYIKYNFTLFPEDPIILKKRDNVWTFEGRLNQSSVERFQ